jgi:pimeloyl-ACP methyl ester carboxylesterase
MTEPTGIRSRTVTANGLRMHVTEAGGGTPVLLLHGFPESSREWASVMTSLADRARLIAPDLRGAGQTEAPASGYDSATVVRDVVGLLDALGLDRVDLVAHDWGAIVGFDLCLDHPDRIRRYVAVAVPAPYIRMNPALLAALIKALPHLWFQWAVATPGLGPALLSRGRQRLTRWILRGFENRPMDDADVAAYLEALRDPARARAASKLYRGLILPAFMNAVRGTYSGRVLNTPTLVLFGAEDALLPRNALEVSSEDAPHTRVEFVPDGAHYLVDDNPDEVARRIGAFFELPAA